MKNWNINTYLQFFKIKIVSMKFLKDIDIILNFDYSIYIIIKS